MAPSSWRSTASERAPAKPSTAAAGARRAFPGHPKKSQPKRRSSALWTGSTRIVNGELRIVNCGAVVRNSLFTIHHSEFNRMLIGRVIGDVVATQKAPSHVGQIGRASC